MTDREFGEDTFPPPSPAAELAAPDDPAFVAECLSQLTRLNQFQPLEVGAHILTLNDRWGAVFRADFRFEAAEDSDLANRLVCWKDSEGKTHVTFAIGQDLAPLGACA